jgi:hypothetical protein
VHARSFPWWYIGYIISKERRRRKRIVKAYRELKKQEKGFSDLRAQTLKMFFIIEEAVKLPLSLLILRVEIS